MKKVCLAILILLLFARSGPAAVSVIGPLAHERTARSGEHYDGLILFKNNGPDPAEVRLYKTDYLFYADGRNLYGEPGSHSRSNATWVSLSPNRLVIYPNETVSVHYKVQVPSNPELEGSYWSMIMVEPLPGLALKEPDREKGKAKMGLQTLVRYGIQIVTDIGLGEKQKIQFIDKKIVVEKGLKTLQVDIENIGQRLINPQVWAEIYTSSGASLGRFESGRYRIYPGCSVRHRMDLTGVPQDRYRALVIGDNGDENIFGAQYDLELP